MLARRGESIESNGRPSAGWSFDFGGGTCSIPAHGLLATPKEEPTDDGATVGGAAGVGCGGGGAAGGASSGPFISTVGSFNRLASEPPSGVIVGTSSGNGISGFRAFGSSD